MLFQGSPSPAPDVPLIGIARLARNGDLLHAKASVQYKELPTRHYISRCSSPRMPFGLTINPYRGCEFGCKYCYARYTHEFMELRESEQFENQIFPKQWDAEQFAAELRKVPKDEHIAIGTATDPYQPAERRFGLTRKMLEVIAEHGGLRLSITTKSDLVARDAELLGKIARRHVLHIHMTVTTLDARLARALEPRAPRPDLRLSAVRRLTEAGVQVGVFCSPILPFFNDDADGICAVAREAKRHGASYFGGSPVFLKPCAAKVFLPFVKKEYPQFAEMYRSRFRDKHQLPAKERQRIQDTVRLARDAAGLSRSPVDYQPGEWPVETQLSLFE